MYWTPEDIVRALEEKTVTGQFVLISRQKHYIRVYGPQTPPTNGAPHLVVERYNGTVAFNHSSVAKRIQGIRPRPTPMARIQKNPLGASAGKPGEFKWAISVASAQKRYRTLDGFIDAIVAAFQGSGIGW
jgi:hypothetical protein